MIVLYVCRSIFVTHFPSVQFSAATMNDVSLLTAESYDGGGLTSISLAPSADPPIRPTLTEAGCPVLTLWVLARLGAVVTSLDVEWKPLDTLVTEA